MCVCVCVRARVIATNLRERTEDQHHRADHGLCGESSCSQRGDCHDKHGVEPGRNRLLHDEHRHGGAYDAEKVAGRADELHVGVSECVSECVRGYRSRNKASFAGWQHTAVFQAVFHDGLKGRQGHRACLLLQLRILLSHTLLSL